MSHELKVNKLSFFGVELDVITGHPDFELLFVASQVAAAAGLKNPSNQASVMAKRGKSIKVCNLPSKYRNSVGALHANLWLFDESTVYLMLMRGHAPQSEPFRKWVTEEVLPSIRKTGTYDIAKSETTEGLQFAEELGVLRATLERLEATIALLPEQIQLAVQQAATEALKSANIGSGVSNEASPYEGTQHDSSTFGDVRISYHYRERTTHNFN
ncbi:Bro-N domain-containing protein [Serratia rubidaea]|uniref:Uncharacterized phage-encoded protein n=1 Tax=Serratia rubidaea TaxID=61652 RepID=A0A3S4XAP4_SERRU|nr:BRO family protein [Serratia rubidaea]VEI69249.1 Uncharacterized phage-encoded protein [Serratia rubidaea]